VFRASQVLKDRINVDAAGGSRPAEDD
jgi:hypothetical protein